MTFMTNDQGREIVSNRAFGSGGILDRGRNALNDIQWDASSLIECRISVASRKGFFPFSFASVDGEISTSRSAQ